MKSISIVVAVILVAGFLFIAPTQKASAQGVPFEGCCQLFTGCVNLSESDCIENPNSIQFVEDELCDEQTNRCPGLPPLGDSEPSSVPAIDGWGLIVIAAILGIVGVIVVRR